MRYDNTITINHHTHLLLCVINEFFFFLFLFSLQQIRQYTPVHIQFSSTANLAQNEPCRVFGALYNNINREHSQNITKTQQVQTQTTLFNFNLFINNVSIFTRQLFSFGFLHHHTAVFNVFVLAKKKKQQTKYNCTS